MLILEMSRRPAAVWHGRDGAAVQQLIEALNWREGVDDRPAEEAVQQAVVNMLEKRKPQFRPLNGGESEDEQLVEQHRSRTALLEAALREGLGKRVSAIAASVRSQTKGVWWDEVYSLMRRVPYNSGGFAPKALEGYIDVVPEGEPDSRRTIRWKPTAGLTLVVAPPRRGKTSVANTLRDCLRGQRQLVADILVGEPTAHALHPEQASVAIAACTWNRAARYVVVDSTKDVGLLARGGSLRYGTPAEPLEFASRWAAAAEYGGICCFATYWPVGFPITKPLTVEWGLTPESGPADDLVSWSEQNSTTIVFWSPTDQRFRIRSRYDQGELKAGVTYTQAWRQ